MNFLHRFLSEDLPSYNNICKTDDCIEDLKTTGSCSSTCFKECPLICKIVVVTNLTPPTGIHHEDNLKRFLIIAASSIITTLLLLTLLVLCFKFYYRRRSIVLSRRWSLEEAARNYDYDGSTTPVIIDHPIWHIRTIGLNPSVISSIKVCKYSKSDGVVEGTDCSVCLSEFEEEETLRLLPKCKHAFHLSCIDTWLRSHTNCPLCRAPITMNDDDHSEGLEEVHVMIPEENGEIDEGIEEERDGFVVSTISRDHGEAEESRQRQRVRRSVSLDLRVSEVVVGREKEKEKRGSIGSSIVGRSSFLKRSISYSGK
ncbi:hypothetical protein AALP_AA7G202100 [Arabis alpina]|uniref:RING-type E3 ubiquitin transferase n=1 Tax=Arabis alpina TaxID=50452 RepID=A0A087GJC8_ARAAL|nr:hypothetical protein AALP_AA7G202100 [Arabis alpina]